MRTLLTRLAVLGAFAALVAGCAGSNGTALPIAGGPNGNGGQSGVNNGAATGPAGQGGASALPNSQTPVLIDNGNVATYKWTGYNVNATDAQSTLNAAPDPTPTPNTVNPNPVGPPADTFVGSHAITFTGNGNSQVIFQGPTVGSLQYAIGVPGQLSVLATLSTIVIHDYVSLPTGAAAPTSVQLALVGGSGPSAYEIRLNCSGTPGTGTGANPFATQTCTGIPAFGSTTSNYTGPNAIQPGSSGAFTGVAGARLYLILNFATGSNPATTTNVLGLDYIYARQ